MKILILLTAIATSQLALADTTADANWMKLLVMTTGDSEHYVEHGFSMAAAGTLRLYMQGAKARLDARHKANHKAFCEAFPELREQGLEALAQAIERDIADISALRAELVAGARNAIDPQDRVHLDHVLGGSDHGPKVTMVETNVAALVREGKVPDSRFTSYCSGEKQS